jgi:hypothetical protein
MGIRKSSGLSDKLIMYSILYAVWTYIALRTPFHYYDILLEIGLFGSVFLLAIVLFVIHVVDVIIEKNPLPFTIFIVCTLVPWFLPGITPEDVSFARYGKDYEKVVEMARQHELEHAGKCKENEYLPPKGYEHLTIRKCIVVKYEPVGGRFLFYAEALGPENFCGGFGLLEKKVGDHWHICDEYWN